VRKHRRTPDHHTTSEGCAMAVSYSSRTHCGSGVIDRPPYSSGAAALLPRPIQSTVICTEYRPVQPKYGVPAYRIAAEPPERGSFGFRAGRRQAQAEGGGRAFRPREAHPEASPCDRCPCAAMCGDLQLACRAFSLFVRGDSWRAAPRRPTHGRYLRIFAPESGGSPSC
jgi:hypothetical protein